MMLAALWDFAQVSNIFGRDLKHCSVFLQDLLLLETRLLKIVFHSLYEIYVVISKWLSY